MLAPLKPFMKWLVVSLAILCLFLAGVAKHYHAKSSDLGHKLTTLQAQVEYQNSTAQAKLDALTAERDEKQAQLDSLNASQEKKDADAKARIARLTSELEHRPIRVRLVPQASPCGGGSGSPQGDPAADPNAGSGDTAEAYGLLPEGNHRRLVEVIVEAETVNAAYASCRARLFDIERVMR